MRNDKIRQDKDLGQSPRHKDKRQGDDTNKTRQDIDRQKNRTRDQDETRQDTTRHKTTRFKEEIIKTPRIVNLERQKTI